MSRHSRGGGLGRRLPLRRRLEIVMDDLAKPEREIANEMDCGDDLENR
jgi:hypothetical protein